MAGHAETAREVWVEATVREDHGAPGGAPSAEATERRSLLVNIRLLTRMLADKAFRIPGRTKLYLLGALLYFLSPVDLVPDFIPGFGMVDDAVVVALALRSLNDALNLYRKHLGRNP